ncbi:MAG TPA: cytochrome P450 [Polyangiales bacterium]
MTSLSALPGPGTPALFNTIEYGLAPRRFALRHAARFGRSYRVRGVLGDALFTADPEHVRRIFGADSDALGSLAESTLTWLFGASSVLLTSGSTHRRQRKLLAPPLNGARLRAFGATMRELADKHVGRLRPGAQLRALDLSTEFTLDVIIRTVFGVEADAEDEIRTLRRMLSALVHGVPALAVFAHPLRTPWYPPWARYLRARDEFDAWLTDKIRRRRAQGSSGTDVLSLLLSTRYDDGSAMDEREIYDQLLTLLLAGHETTSLAVASCVGRLLREPEALERLRGELANTEGPEQVQRLPYFSAVIDETLRLDPIVTDVGRVTRAPFTLDERLSVERGQVLVVLIEALHHDPDLYPAPARFRPERFLERKFAPHEYAPFGGGVRRCLGAAFSDYETKILLATLLKRVDLQLVGTGVEARVRRNITMGPKNGVPLRVRSLR